MQYNRGCSKDESQHHEIEGVVPGKKIFSLNQDVQYLGVMSLLRMRHFVIIVEGGKIHRECPAFYVKRANHVTETILHRCLTLFSARTAYSIKVVASLATAHKYHLNLLIVTISFSFKS